MPRRVAVALTIALCAFAGASSAQAARGTLTGSLAGLPANAAFHVVRAVDSRGVIGGAATASASGSYKLSLPPGAWILVGSAQASDRSLTALGAPVRVRSGRRSRERPARVKRFRVRAAASGVLRRGSVVTVRPIKLDDGRGPIFNLFPEYTATVENDLFRACAPRGIIFVDTSAAFRKFAAQEAALSRAGRLATPFDYRPIAPQYEVSSQFGVLNNGNIQFELELVLIRSHRAVADTGVQTERTPIGDTTDEQALSWVHTVTMKLAAKMCGA
jgi:hypothetical protein